MSLLFALLLFFLNLVNPHLVIQNVFLKFFSLFICKLLPHLKNLANSFLNFRSCSIYFTFGLTYVFQDPIEFSWWFIYLAFGSFDDLHEVVVDFVLILLFLKSPLTHLLEPRIQFLSLILLYFFKSFSLPIFTLFFELL